MTTTVTRADREMAAKTWQGGVYVPLDAAEKSDLLISEWIRSGLGLLKMHEGLPQLAHAFANHRAASTQALKEAAERLCVALDSLDANGYGALLSPAVKRESAALRSALAAETSGGGDGRR